MIKLSRINTIAVVIIISANLFSQPVDFQLLQRDPETGQCRVSYSTSSGTAQLKVYADDQLQETITERTDGSLTAEIDAGLKEYKFELVNGGNILESAERVACGDAYLIYGQSNAEAGYGAQNYTYTNDFIRTYQGSWTVATSQGGRVGGWGLHLARLILEKHQVPVCIINGAKGNTAVRHLVRDAVYDPQSTVPGEAGFYTETAQWGNYYKRMQAWVEEAGLTDGVRALLWHQGERQVYSDLEDPALYYQEFMGLREQLYEDYPALEKLFLFQIRPGCGSGLGFSIVNEHIRNLAIDHEDIEVMTTLSYGVAGCHYGEQQLEGYQIIGADMFPLVDVAFYGAQYDESVTSPNILQVAFTGDARDELVLQFDQEVKWNAVLEFDPDEFSHEFYQNECNGQMPSYLRQTFAFDSNASISNQVVSGRSEGNLIYLQLDGAVNYTHLAYPAGRLNGCWAGPYITRPDSSTGALMFHVEIRDELDTTISGCMDSNYAEYSPDAMLHDSSACITLGTVNSRSAAPLVWSQTREEVTVSVDFAGEYAVELWNTRGTRLKVLNGLVLQSAGEGGSGSREYRITKKGLPAGVYQIRVLWNGSGITRAFVIY